MNLLKYFKRLQLMLLDGILLENTSKEIELSSGDYDIMFILMEFLKRIPHGTLFYEMQQYFWPVYFHDFNKWSF